jgi:hypothetical protein
MLVGRLGSFRRMIYRARWCTVHMSVTLARFFEKRVRICDEFHHASPAAKVIGLVPMLLFPGSPRRIHIHAADRIDDGFILPTGLLDGGSRCERGHEALRVFLELRHAVLAAEVIRLPVMLVRSGSALWIYVHAANWVGSHTYLLVAILTLTPADARPLN